VPVRSYCAAPPPYEQQHRGGEPGTEARWEAVTMVLVDTLTEPRLRLREE
jgi:hypothetical protein